MTVNNGFAWDHGYYAPEIDNTWLGIVGPGVANKGVDGLSAGRRTKLVRHGELEPAARHAT